MFFGSDLALIDSKLRLYKYVLENRRWSWFIRERGALMGFFNKVLNRIDVGRSKLSRASLESNLELEEEEVRRILCEGFLRLAAHSTSGDDLRWLAMEMPSNLVKLLLELGKSMRKRGLKLRASDPTPTYDKLIEQIVGKNEDIDEIEERYIQLIAPFIEQLVGNAATEPLSSLAPPKNVRTVVSEMAKALNQYVKEIATIQEELTNAKIEVEKGETEYAAMGESISEEISRRGQKVANTANKQLDILSGKEVLAVVQARLDLQARYNDVLATKLEEALARIEKLERLPGGITNARH